MKAVVGHRLALLGCALLALSPAGARAAPLAGCPTSASFAGASFKSTFDLPHAATARFGPALPASSASAAGSASLLLTTFGVGASADSVQVLPQPAAAFNAQSLLSLDASTAWPNEIAPVPKGANVSAQGKPGAGEAGMVTVVAVVAAIVVPRRAAHTGSLDSFFLFSVGSPRPRLALGLF